MAWESFITFGEGSPSSTLVNFDPLRWTTRAGGVVFQPQNFRDNVIAGGVNIEYYSAPPYFSGGNPITNNFPWGTEDGVGYYDAAYYGPQGYPLYPGQAGTLYHHVLDESSQAISHRYFKTIYHDASPDSPENYPDTAQYQFTLYGSTFSSYTLRSKPQPEDTYVTVNGVDAGTLPGRALGVMEYHYGGDEDYGIVLMSGLNYWKISPSSGITFVGHEYRITDLTGIGSSSDNEAASGLLYGPSGTQVFVYPGQPDGPVVSTDPCQWAASETFSDPYSFDKWWVSQSYGGNVYAAKGINGKKTFLGNVPPIHSGSVYLRTSGSTTYLGITYRDDSMASTALWKIPPTVVTPAQGVPYGKNVSLVSVGDASLKAVNRW